MQQVNLEQKQGNWHGSFKAMASPCEVLLETDDAAETRRLAQAVAAEAWRIEDKFSRYLPGNVVGRINTSGGSPIEVDDETIADVLAKGAGSPRDTLSALEVAASSGGMRLALRRCCKISSRAVTPSMYSMTR